MEPANHVHLARNDGKTPVTLYALYLGIPKSARANVQAAQPSGCNVRQKTPTETRAAGTRPTTFSGREATVHSRSRQVAGSRRMNPYRCKAAAVARLS